MKLLLLGGTTEGRVLAQRLGAMGHSVTVTVATDYGAELLHGLDVEVLTGRMDEGQMERCFSAYDQIIDATHPYAVEVSQNARCAAQNQNRPYHRLVRPAGAAEDWWQSVPDMASAVDYLEQTSGNVLLTTGSKDLKIFSTLKNYRERLWVRILASHDSLELALSAGFPSSHIIAMQGPFSAELNEALLRQFDIKILVTKRSGKAGGFAEKAQAVRRVGGTLLVVERPVKEAGETEEELLHNIGPA